MPFFVAEIHQHGHGLRSILSGLIRRIILPFFRANGKTIASKAIKTGVQVGDDLAQGTSFKESAKGRIPEV